MRNKVKNTFINNNATILIYVIPGIGTEYIQPSNHPINPRGNHEI